MISLNGCLEKAATKSLLCFILFQFQSQLGNDPKNLEWLKTINARCLAPDLTIFIDTSLSICEKRRAKNRWYQDLYEKPHILSQVIKNYKYAIENIKPEMPIETIDGNPSEKVVFNEILSLIKQKFPHMFPGDLPLFPLK